MVRNYALYYFFIFLIFHAMATLYISLFKITADFNTFNLVVMADLFVHLNGQFLAEALR